MSDYVWISKASVADLTNRTFAPPQVTERGMSDEFRETSLQNQRGFPLPKEKFPADIYASKGASYHKMEPIDLFTCNFWYVSRKCKDVLNEFDMGQGNFYPVRLWTPDGKTQLDQEFYHLNFGNIKSALLPDQSPNIEKFGDGTERWSAPMFESQEDQVVFSKHALEGSDIWVDERIPSRFLISNRLKEALDREKLSTIFRLYRCPIVEGE